LFGIDKEWLPAAVSRSTGYNPDMTRSELIALIAERFPQFPAKDAELAVSEILFAMHHALTRGNRIEIRGIGSFAANYRPPRTARNPKTGEPVAVGGKWVPHFKAGKDLRDRVMATAGDTVVAPSASSVTGRG
jgi:integration host factor subunit beta